MSVKDDKWLKERLGAVPYKPDPRDYQVCMVTPEMLGEIPEVTKILLDYVSNEYDRSQGNIGQCVGFCNCYATETAHNIAEKSNYEINLSESWVYQKSRERAGIPLPGEGSTNFGAMKALNKDGVCLEKLCKNDLVRPFEFDPEDGAEEDAVQRKIHSYYRVATNPVAMKAALMGLTHDPGYKMPDGSRGMCPLVTAYNVYSSFKLGYEDGVVPMPAHGDELLGGHSSLIVGWIMIDGEEYWINYNSWGTEIGGSLTNTYGEKVKGLFFLPIEYEFRDAWVFSIDEPIDPPEPEPSNGLGCSIARWLMKTFNCKEVEK